MKDNRFTVEGFTNALTGKIKKQMNKLEIEIPEGHEIDQEKSNLDKGLIIFKKKKSRPMRFEDVNIKDYHYYKPFRLIEGREVRMDHLIVKTEYVRAFRALSELVILRDAWNEGWEADWDDETQEKVIITLMMEEFRILSASSRHPLVLKDEETAKAFLDQFRYLIEKAKPLL